MALLKEINKKIGTQIQTGGFHRMGNLLVLCIIVVLTMEMVYNTGSVTRTAHECKVLRMDGIFHCLHLHRIYQRPPAGSSFSVAQ